MNYNPFLALLVHKGIITEEEGERLSQEFNSVVHSQDWGTALRTVEGILKKIEKDKPFSSK